MKEWIYYDRCSKRNEMQKKQSPFLGMQEVKWENGLQNIFLDSGFQVIGFDVRK